MFHLLIGILIMLNYFMIESGHPPEGMPTTVKIILGINVGIGIGYYLKTLFKEIIK